MARRPELMIMSGELSGKRFAVPKEGLRFGRSSSNDVHILDEELSRNHCLFEQKGTDGLTVVDLASANGTYVNGVALGAEARELSVGDLVKAGKVDIRVVGEGGCGDGGVPAPRGGVNPAGAVDLGLGAGPAGDAKAGAAAGTRDACPYRKPNRRRLVANVLWGVTILVISLAIGLVLLAPTKSGSGEKSAAALADSASAPGERLLSLSYEKVEADAARIFRYQMTVDETGLLRVTYDDVPGENRHVDKTGKLGEKALARIREIFQAAGWQDLEPAYMGQSAASENALRRWSIRIVTETRVKEVTVENVLEPEPFAAVREALEAFSQNELGIWALQYSREQLIALSAESARIGDTRSEERDVEYGNLSAAVKAYREAVFYLDTVNPKPADYPALKQKLVRVTEELAQRYKDQRFRADKAINLGDWETAKRELRILCDLVPEKDDARHAEAEAKLVDVENRIVREKKGGRK